MTSASQSTAARDFDVFLCHNSDEKPLIANIAARLTDEYGIRCWLDAWVIPAGVEWAPALDEALAGCGACAVFLGSKGWGEVHLREADSALKRLATQPDFRVIPVLLPGAREEDIALRPDLFSSRHRADYRASSGPEHAFQVLRAAVGRDAPGPPPMSAFTIRRDAQRWNAVPKSDLLYRGVELVEAQKIAEAQPDALNPQAVQFLAASALEERQQAQRRKQRTQFVIAGLSLLAAIALVLAFYANRKRILAEEQTAAVLTESGLAADADGETFAALHSYAAAADVASDSTNGRMTRSRLTLRGQLVPTLMAIDDLRTPAVFLRAEPGGTRMLVTTERTVRLIDVTRSTPPFDIESSPALNLNPVAAVFSGNGAFIATQASDGKFAVRRDPHGAPVCTAPANNLTALDLGMSGRLLVATSATEVVVWDVASCKSSFAFKTASDTIRVQSAALSPDDTILAIADVQGHISLFRIRDRMPIGTLSHGTQVYRVAFNRAGDVLLTTGNESVKLWDWRANTLIREMPGFRFVVSEASFSPDGHAVAMASQSEDPRVWRLDGPVPPAVMNVPRKGRTPNEFPSSVKFDATGTRILTFQADTAILWDAFSAQRVLTIRGHTGGPFDGRLLDAAMSGDVLVTSAMDGTLRYWRSVACTTRSSSRRWPRDRSSPDCPATPRSFGEFVSRRMAHPFS